MTSRTGRPPAGRIASGTHLGSRTKKPPTKGVWWSAQAVKVTAWSAWAGVGGRPGLLGVQQPGHLVEGGGDRQGGGLALADLDPDLELVVVSVAVGSRVRPGPQVRDQQRPEGEIGGPRLVRRGGFPGHPEVAVVAVQPARVGQAPRSRRGRGGRAGGHRGGRRLGRWRGWGAGAGRRQERDSHEQPASSAGSHPAGRPACQGPCSTHWAIHRASTDGLRFAATYILTLQSVPAGSLTRVRPLAPGPSRGGGPLTA